MGVGKGSREEVRSGFHSEYPLPTGKSEGRTLIKVSSFMTSDKWIISYKIIKKLAHLQLRGPPVPGF